MKSTKISQVKTLLGVIILTVMVLLTSCGGYTSVTNEEAFRAGETIGRIIGGY